MRSAAPSSRAASATPSSSSTPSPTTSRSAISARRTSSKSCSTPRPRPARTPSSIKRGLVSGAALPASLRAELAARGVAVLQCYAIAETGVIAYESEAREGMIVNENIILEIVRPGTGDPVADGEVGEVVVTSFNPDYPMIRLATGDLSAVLAGVSPCGRTNTRIKGWMGRADQTTKVKGMFVHPEQIAEIAKRHPGAWPRAPGGHPRGRAGRDDAACGDRRRPTRASPRRCAATLQSVTKVRGAVKLVPPGLAAERRQGDRRRAPGRLNRVRQRPCFHPRFAAWPRPPFSTWSSHAPVSS